MSSQGYKHAPSVRQGKIYAPTPIKNIGQSVPDSHLKTRMKADDSASVLMSDNKLGKPISSN